MSKTVCDLNQSEYYFESPLKIYVNAAIKLDDLFCDNAKGVYMIGTTLVSRSKSWQFFSCESFPNSVSDFPPAATNIHI